MAAALLAPKNGAIALNVGGAADFSSFDVSESQQSESVAAYGAAVNDNYLASGTTHFSLSTSAFAKAHAASTPAFGVMTAAGGAATVTMDTGVTLAGNFAITSVRLSHARLRAAVPIQFTAENSGDITTTWPAT